MRKQLTRLFRSLPGWLLITTALAGTALFATWIQDIHDREVDLHAWTGNNPSTPLDDPPRPSR